MNIIPVENFLNKLEIFYFPIKRENVQGVGRFGGREIGIQIWKSSSSSKKNISEFSVSRNPQFPSVIIAQYKTRVQHLFWQKQALHANWVINALANMHPLKSYYMPHS